MLCKYNRMLSTKEIFKMLLVYFTILGVGVLGIITCNPENDSPIPVVEEKSNIICGEHEGQFYGCRTSIPCRVEECECACHK